MKRIMLDLETLGSRPGSVILAVGAVKFTTEQGGGVIDTFYRRVCPDSCQEAGLRIDAGTVMWWMKQSDAARLELLESASPIWEVIADFRGWLNGEPDEVWGNGPDFDNALMDEACEILRLPLLWSHRKNRCFRTMRAVFMNTPAGPPAHHALKDALKQTEELLEIFGRVARVMER